MKKLATIAIIAIAGLSSIVAKAGAVPGPKVANTSVNANSVDCYTIVFRGGEDARVFVKGDGDTDLDLFVYDENGNMVDCDVDPTDACLALFRPKWTGTFIIRVVNHGSVYNSYRLTTN